MTSPKLSSLLIAAALTGAPLATAWAAPSSTANATTTVVEAPIAAPAATRAPTGAAAEVAPLDEASKYAQREAANPDAAKFRGGSTVLVIGGSTTAIVLLVVLLVVLL